MKAAIWTKYGKPEVLQIKEINKPTPKDDEILIKIHAATANAGDCEMRQLKFAPHYKFMIRLFVGFFKPKRVQILGQELSGEVVEIGKNVTEFKVGDQIFAGLGFSFGAYAEYICLPEKNGDHVIVKKPTNASFEEAAVIPVGGLNALHFLRNSNIQSGQKILINGAGGSIGTIAIQLAKSYGAEVTAVDSETKLDMLKSIGADYVVDYTQEDFTKRNEKYDILFDVVGKAPYKQSIQALKQNGVYLLGNPSFLRSLRGRFTTLFSRKKVFDKTVNYKAENLAYLKEQIEAGKIKAVIDRSFPLEKIAEAHEYVENKHKKGNIVIKIP